MDRKRTRVYEVLGVQLLSPVFGLAILKPLKRDADLATWRKVPYKEYLHAKKKRFPVRIRYESIQNPHWLDKRP